MDIFCIFGSPKADLLPVVASRRAVQRKKQWNYAHCGTDSRRTPNPALQGTRHRPRAPELNVKSQHKCQERYECMQLARSAVAVAAAAPSRAFVPDREQNASGARRCRPSSIVTVGGRRLIEGSGSGAARSILPCCHLTWQANGTRSSARLSSDVWARTAPSMHRSKSECDCFSRQPVGTSLRSQW